ncbi:hypothetical protein JW905_13930 [bacterium]|nr:hypothetical protein [candidate division CSSED10-310 bacterium]
MRRRLLALILGCTVAVILGEGLCVVVFYGYHGTASVPELLKREKVNTYEQRFLKNGTPRFRGILPHSYLEFVLNSDQIDGVNNTGFLGHDFPPLKDESKFTILVTGGSVCCQLCESVRDTTNYLEKLLNDRYDFNGKEAVVLNGGLGGWCQPQQAILLLLYGEVIDAIVTVDGFNEFFEASDEGTRLEHPWQELTTIHPLAQPDRSVLMSASVTNALYLWSWNSWILRHSRILYLITHCARKVFERWGRAALDEVDTPLKLISIFSVPPDWDMDQTFMFNISLYKKYIRYMAAMARAQGIRSLFFIQPVPAIDKKLTPKERLVVGDLGYGDRYRQMTQELLDLEKEGLAVVSLLDVFSSVESAIYADHIHCRLWDALDGDNNGYYMMSERIVSHLENHWGLKRKGE